MTVEEFEALVGREINDRYELLTIGCPHYNPNSDIHSHCGLCTHGYPRIAQDRPCPKCKAESQPGNFVMEFWHHCNEHGLRRTKLAGQCEECSQPEPTMREIIGSDRQPPKPTELTEAEAARYAGMSVEQWRRLCS